LLLPALWKKESSGGISYWEGETSHESLPTSLSLKEGVKGSGFTGSCGEAKPSAEKGRAVAEPSKRKEKRPMEKGDARQGMLGKRKLASKEQVYD